MRFRMRNLAVSVGTLKVQYLHTIDLSKVETTPSLIFTKSIKNWKRQGKNIKNSPAKTQRKKRAKVPFTCHPFAKLRTASEAQLKGLANERDSSLRSE